MSEEIQAWNEEAIETIFVLYYEWRIFGECRDETKSKFLTFAKLIAEKQKEETMSWGIKTVGRTKDVLAEVNGNQYVPQYVKDTVTAIATDNQTKEAGNQQCDGLYVEGYGHQGAGCPSSLRLKVEPFHIAPTAPQVEADAPAAASAPAPEAAPAAEAPAPGNPS